MCPLHHKVVCPVAPQQSESFKATKEKLNATLRHRQVVVPPRVCPCRLDLRTSLCCARARMANVALLTIKAQKLQTIVTLLVQPPFKYHHERKFLEQRKNQNHATFTLFFTDFCRFRWPFGLGCRPPPRNRG